MFYILFIIYLKLQNGVLKVTDRRSMSTFLLYTKLIANIIIRRIFYVHNLALK